MVVGCLIIMASSCKKYLDIDPKGYTIPKTVEDYDRILNGVYLVQFMPIDLDILSDDIFVSGASKDPTDNNTEGKVYAWAPFIYTSNYDLQYNHPWNLLYANIFQYNAIINNIDAATNGTANQKNKIKAQALFGRAMSYWYLVNLFSKPYTVDGSATDLGVPLVTGNDINAAIPDRGTVQKTYEFILKDLEEALNNLPSSSVTKYRPTKAAGFALLARTYLHMRDYKKSMEAATSALAIQGTVLNYNDITSYNGSGTYTLTNTTAFEESMERHPEYIYSNLFSYVFGMQGQYLSSSLIDLLPQSDIRRMYFSEENDNGIVRYQQNFFYYTNIGFTTTEMYLIQAEAKARLDNLVGALEDINKLRKNRILTVDYTPLYSDNKHEVIQWILDEKRREFFFKGMRWFEMRRLSVDPEFSFTAHHYFDNGSSVSLEPGSNRYMLAIPETALSKGIPQNPR